MVLCDLLELTLLILRTVFNWVVASFFHRVISNDSDGFSFCLCKEQSASMILRLFEMRRTSHLSGLNFISHFSSQSWSLFRSSCNAWVSAFVLIVLYNSESSANNLTVDWTQWGRSLIYARNKRGPSTIPWGTPDVTGAGLDVFPSRVTCWCLLLRKLWIQQRVLPRTPQ